MRELLEDLFEAFARWGRWGALPSAVAAVLLGGAGSWMLARLGPWNGAELWSFGGTLAGAVACGLALIAAAQSVRLLVRGGPPRRPALARGELLERAAIESRPFRVCLDCRVFVDPLGGPCERCGRLSGILEVREAADLDMLAAGIPD